MIHKKFAIWGNTEKDTFWETLPGIFKWAESKNLEIFLTQRISRKLPNPEEYVYKEIQSADDLQKADFLLVLGGDGTILSACRAVEDRQISILGIHLGDLGFLAKVTLPDLYSRLDQVLQGDFTTESRMALTCKVQDLNQNYQFVAINDVVIDRGHSHRMLNCKLMVNKQFVGNYRADGIIIATPTGSTAYSLSSGGPIVEPDVSSIVVTPICPHTLTSRPLVLSDNKILTFSFEANIEDKISIVIDGQIIKNVSKQAKVSVEKSSYKISFIKFPDTDYFSTLRTKMGWGKRGEL